jgi:hypothetical protein
VKAFHLQAVDGLQGYTVLTMPSNDEEGDSPNGYPTVGVIPLPVGFAIWEVTSGTTARS